MPRDLTDVVTATTAAFVNAAKALFPEIENIAGVETPSELERVGDDGPAFERVISTKTVADETEFKFGSADLSTRILFDACYPVLNEMSTKAKRPLDVERRRSIRLGVWVEKQGFTVTFFAYAEICMEKQHAR